MVDRTLLLVDGSSYLYRAYHALPDLRTKGGEPVVQRTVIEDKGAKIEELRVRGNLQRVVVTPRGPAPGYEVLTSDGYHPTADDPGTSRGSAGKRVWSVLRF